MELQSRVENILKLTTSPNKEERTQAETYLNDCLKNAEFVHSLLNVYMKSSDPVVANVAAGIFKSGVKNIEDKKTIIMEAIQEMGNEIRNNFSQLVNSMRYKMIKDVILNYLQPEYYDEALLISENNEYLLMEILYIILRNCKLGSVVLREIIGKYWNFIEQVSRNESYNTLLIEIIEVAVKKNKFEDAQAQFIINYITAILINSADLKQLESITEIFNNIYLGVIKEKVIMKGFRLIIMKKEYIDEFFKQLINLMMKYKEMENERLLINCAEILTLFANNGYFLNHLPQLVDLIIIPSLYGDEELFDDFFTDTEEYSNKIYNLYIETYGEVLSNLLYDASMKLYTISRKKRVINKFDLYVPSPEEADSILETIYKYLLNNLEEYNKHRNEEHIKPPHISDIFNRKYASVILLTTLYRLPSKYFIYIFNSVLKDLQSNSTIMKAHSCYLVERFSFEMIDDEDKNEIIKLILEVANYIIPLLKDDVETVRLSAIMTIPIFLYDEITAYTREVIEKNLMTILSSILQTSGLQDNETLDSLIMLFPEQIQKYGSQIIISLFQRIHQSYERGKKEIITNYMRSISDLIVLGRSKSFNKNDILQILNQDFTLIFKLLIVDYFYLQDLIDMLSNFVYALNDSQSLFTFVDQILNIEKDELLCVSEELCGLLDNIVCFHNSMLTPINGNIAKYLISYEYCANEKELRNLIRNVKQDDIMVVLASDLLSSLFNLQVEGESYNAEKAIAYVDFYKALILNDTSYIFEDEYIQICKVITSVLLTYTKNISASIIANKYKDYLDFLLNNHEMLEDGSPAHLFGVSVIFLIITRSTELSNEITAEQLSYIFDIFYKSTGNSLRVHEYNIFLLFFARVMPMNNIFKNIQQNHIRKMAYCFHHYFKNYDRVLLDRYSMEEDSFDHFTEDICFISPLDNINTKLLLIDSMSSFSQNSLGQIIINSLTPEEMEELKAIFKN